MDWIKYSKPMRELYNYFYPKAWFEYKSGKLGGKTPFTVFVSKEKDQVTPEDEAKLRQRHPELGDSKRW